MQSFRLTIEGHGHNILAQSEPVEQFQAGLDSLKGLVTPNGSSPTGKTMNRSQNQLLLSLAVYYSKNVGYDTDTYLV